MHSMLARLLFTGILFHVFLLSNAQDQAAAIDTVKHHFKKALAKKVTYKKQDATWLYGYYESDHTMVPGIDSIFISYAESDEAPKRDDVRITYDYGNVQTKLHNYTLALKDINRVSIAPVTAAHSETGFLKIETNASSIHARWLHLEASYEVPDPSWEGGGTIKISAAIMKDESKKVSWFLLPYYKSNQPDEQALIRAVLAAAGK